MKRCKVISHKIKIEYICPNTEKEYVLEVNNPYIGQGQYFEDWSYTFVDFECPHCKKFHMFEIL